MAPVVQHPTYKQLNRLTASTDGHYVRASAEGPTQRGSIFVTAEGTVVWVRTHDLEALYTGVGREDPRTGFPVYQSDGT